MPSGAITPTRLLDTRTGAAPLGEGRTIGLTVTGSAGIPASGVGAVIVNITATQPTAAGYVTAWPTGQPRPATSNINFGSGQTTANLAVVQVGTNGQINLYNAKGTTHLIVDILAWLPGTQLAASPALAAVPLAFDEIATAQAPSDLASRSGSPLLYVAERGGTVRSVDPTSGAVSEPLVDLSDDLASDGERGLLGLAFSPDGARLYVSFNPSNGNSRIDEFEMSGDTVVVASRRTVIEVSQPPADNHKGGHLTFGPDGMLWWGLGDGGGEGDPFANGQNLSTLLGGMVRIDPSGRDHGGYSVPSDNPWVTIGAAPEKWLTGLRNPWRFSFDRATGDLWIADVGQDSWEEVDALTAPLRGNGANLGWPAREGAHPYQGDAPAGVVDPIFEYAHGDNDANGCAITGGYVYRGNAIPELRGAYLYSDYCVSTLRGIRNSPAGIDAADFGAHLRGDAIVTFGEGPDGELYAASITSGAIGRIVRG